MGCIHLFSIIGVDPRSWLFTFEEKHFFLLCETAWSSTSFQEGVFASSGYFTLESIPLSSSQICANILKFVCDLFSYCCMCKTVVAHIGLFMVTMACLTTCAALVWVQWHIKHELDSLRKQVDTGTCFSLFLFSNCVSECLL